MPGKLVLTSAALALAVSAVAAYGAGTAGPVMGPSSKIAQPAFRGYYDGHKDTYLSTDVSSKSQAKTLRINYAATLTGAKGASPMYLVQGPAAAGQVAVFGSEPGEKDYSPLWQEITVRWKSGHTPVLLIRDDQIKSLAKKGSLTMTATPIVLNGPVVKVGKKS